MVTSLALILVAAAAAEAPAANEAAPAEAPATQAEAPSTQANASAVPADAPAAPAAQGLSLDFDLLEGAAPAAAAVAIDPVFEAQLQRRRTMLQVHQAVGLATWTSLVATEVVGQLNYLDKYNQGGATGRWKLAHLGLAITSTALFASGATLGLFAPDPFQKELKLDFSTLHKVFMSVAAAGLVGQFLLGMHTASLDGQLHQRDLALAHLVMGYATVGAFSAGAVMLMF